MSLHFHTAHRLPKRSPWQKTTLVGQLVNRSALAWKLVLYLGIHPDNVWEQLYYLEAMYTDRLSDGTKTLLTLYYDSRDLIIYAQD